jgi:hypothetical protein
MCYHAGWMAGSLLNFALIQDEDKESSKPDVDPFTTLSNYQL